MASKKAVATTQSFGWKDVAAVLLALVGIGAGYAADHRATVITVVVLVVVWLINMLFRWKGIKLGKRWLTAILYVLAVGLAIAFNPVVLPSAPIYSGDPAAFAQALVAYISALAAIGAAIVTAATVLYNTLLEQVLQKIPFPLPAAKKTK